MKVRNITFIAVMTALLCVLAPVAIPMEPVPISLATLIVYLIGGIFPLKKSLPIVATYIILGIIGLPVFAGFSGGLQIVLGPTGGYIIGYMACVTVQSLMVRNKEKNTPLQALSMILGTLLLYTIGTTWFMIYTNGAYTLEKALLLCVLPFILGDTIKIIIATILSSKLRKLLDNYKLV